MKCDKLWEEVAVANAIAIAGHIRPDGDCVGSCMGLARYLRKKYPKKRVDVYFEVMPNSFSDLFLEGEYRVGYEDMEPVDLFFAMDCSDSERLGGALSLFEQTEKTICIDHHISNVGYAKQNYIVADASSASEVLFELLEEDSIDKEIATAIYLGIVHDSGVFKYSNTSKRTMEIGGILVDKKVETTYIIDHTFYSKSYKQNQIMGRVLMESILALDGKVIIGSMSQKMMRFYEANNQDLDGIVEQLRITEGVEMALFLHETAPMVYKVSMRANEKVNVSEIALHFGGGGHIKAAGCTIAGNYYDVINGILELVDLQLKEIK